MRCPICKAEVDETTRDRKGSVYPFCSERCKLIDLGRWLGERYKVPVEDDEPPAGPRPDEDDA